MAQNQNEGERIAKVIARAGLASRREAEAWIAAGRVSVNGAKITSPALNVTRADRIVVDGKPLPGAERTRLFLYHKPRGLVTTSSDPQGRPTIFGALPKNLPRLISIGRLDLSTEGLLLLTNDGGLARALELPATGWLRRYRVRAYGKVTQPQLDALRDGVTVDGVNYGPIDAVLDREQTSNVWITFAIREGKNREVRNVLRHLGLQVGRLIRISFGPFQLGELEEGAVAEVPTRILRDQLGEKLAKAAGADFSAPIVERKVELQKAAAPAKRSEGHRTCGASHSVTSERSIRARRRRKYPAVRCAAKAAATPMIHARNPPPGPLHGPASPASGGGIRRSRARCASSAAGCAGARWRHRSRKASARPRIACANRCSTS
jgi:23S rRNA pseudouridine2605 synthase